MSNPKVALVTGANRGLGLATARKLALLVYRVLKHKILYQEQTADEYDQRQRARILRGLRKRASSLGFALVDTTTGLVME